MLSLLRPVCPSLFPQHALANGQLTIKAPWIAKEQYGHLLKWLCYESVAAAVEALLELQRTANELNFPKGEYCLQHLQLSNAGNDVASCLLIQACLLAPL